MSYLPRIVHLVSEFSGHEAIGRTIVETARRIPAEHHLVAAAAHDSTDGFATATAVGGSLSTFTMTRRAEISSLLDHLRPDLVHVHGGPLASVAALAPGLRGRRSVHTIYAWPTLPGPSALRHASPRQLISSNVVRPRVIATSALSPGILRSLLRRSGARAVLTPDPVVLERLGDRPVLPVLSLPSGASTDERRASRDPEHPVVVFAGRAEWVRGIGTLLAAVPRLRLRHPEIRIRLLLLATAELPAVLERIEQLSAADRLAVEVEVGPQDDIRSELAASTVGVWPFAFDYTTSPPAMALAEAMSVGLPVVSTPVGCVRAVARDGVNADLVPVGDAAALADAVSRLIDNPALWAQRSTAGVDTIVTRLNWDAAMKVTAVAYDMALPATIANRAAGVAA